MKLILYQGMLTFFEKPKFLVTIIHPAVFEVRFRDNMPLYTWGAWAQLPGLSSKLSGMCTLCWQEVFTKICAEVAHVQRLLVGFGLHIPKCKFESDEFHPNDSELIRAYGHLVYRTPRCQSNDNLLICSRASYESSLSTASGMTKLHPTYNHCQRNRYTHTYIYI